MRRPRAADDTGPVPSGWLRLVPMAVVALVVAADIAVGRGQVVLGLVVTAPLLAATIVGTSLTAVYGVIAFAVVALGGTWDGQYAAASRAAQAVRLTAAVLSGVAGVAAARYRQRHEARLRQLTRVAEAAQRAILIPVPDRLNTVHLAVGYESAASEALIGGDLYAAVSDTDRLRLLVADVRGKGLEAVRLSAQVLAAFRERVWDHEELPALLVDLDRAVRRTAAAEDFVTAALAELTDAGCLRVILAGHPSPLIVRRGVVVPVPDVAVGAPLGLDGDPAGVAVLSLIPGDRMLLYTDGLSEARRPRDGTFFDLGRAVPLLASGPLRSCLEDLTAALRRWTAGALSDDVALLLLEYDPVAVQGDVQRRAQPSA